MGKPVIIEVNQFRSGLMTGQSPRLIPGDAATASTNVDYSSGTIKGLRGPGSSVYNSSGVKKFIHLKDGVGWVSETSRGFSCQDGSHKNGSGSTIGISYYVIGSDNPRISAGANYYDKVLGVPAPSTPTLNTNGSSGTRSYRVVTELYIDNLDSVWSSNPSGIFSPTSYLNCKLNISRPASNGTGYSYYTTIWATQPGTSTEPYYLIDYIDWSSVVGSTKVWQDTGLPPAEPNTMLSWDVGGLKDLTNTVYAYDHSYSPTMSVIAGSLMGVSGTPEPSRAYLGIQTLKRFGILFGASGSRLYWSANGYPWYWPQLNSIELDNTIEAIVVDRATAFVVTQSSIYAISGPDDQNLSITKTSATHGCLPDCGQAVKQTPYGIIYPSPLGLAIFSGDSSSILTDGLLNPGIDIGQNPVFGAYWNNSYIIKGADKGYFVNLLSYPRVSITNITSSFTAATVAFSYSTSSSTAENNQLYVFDSSDGKIKPWNPRVSSSIAPLSFSHTSGHIDAGEPNKKKKFTRFWPSGTPGLSYELYCKNFDGSLVSSCSLTSASWLPGDFTGDYLQVVVHATNLTYVSSTTNPVELLGFKVEAEIYD